MGRFLELSIEDFVLGMFEEFKLLFDRYLKTAPTPGMPGICLQTNVQEVSMHGEHCSMVGRILYFVKSVTCLC